MSIVNLSNSESTFLLSTEQNTILNEVLSTLKVLSTLFGG